jgi:hypothetical protein
MHAHRSQVRDETLTRFAAFPAPLRDHYVCVASRVPILIPEDDLFAGVSGTSCKGGVTHDREANP